MINIEEVEKEASQAKDAINGILSHFMVRTGCTLILTQTLERVGASFDITDSSVEAQVVLGVK